MRRALPERAAANASSGGGGEASARFLAAGQSNVAFGTLAPRGIVAAARAPIASLPLAGTERSPLPAMHPANILVVAIG